MLGIEPKAWSTLGRSPATKLDPQPALYSNRSCILGEYFRRNTWAVVSRIDRLRSRELGGDHGICGKKVEVLSKISRDESGLYVTFQK